MINKNDLRKAISSIAISNAKRNTIYKAFSDLGSIPKEEFDSIKSDISKVVESMLTKDTVGKANGVASLDSNGSVPIKQLGNIDTTLFLIVRELPTTDIKTNKIYLIPNKDDQGNNIYVEYLYVENVWENLGEFKVEVDFKKEGIYRVCKETQINVSSPTSSMYKNYGNGIDIWYPGNNTNRPGYYDVTQYDEIEVTNISDSSLSYFLTKKIGTENNERIAYVGYYKSIKTLPAGEIQKVVIPDEEHVYLVFMQIPSVVKTSISMRGFTYVNCMSNKIPSSDVGVNGTTLDLEYESTRIDITNLKNRVVEDKIKEIDIYFYQQTNMPLSNKWDAFTTGNGNRSILIPLSEHDNRQIRLMATNNKILYSFLTSDDVSVPPSFATGYTGLVTLSQGYKRLLTIPDNARFLCLKTRDHVSGDIRGTYKAYFLNYGWETSDEKMYRWGVDSLDGKKLCILGDSISAGAKTAKSYVSYLQEYFNLDVNNYAIAGAMWTYVENESPEYVHKDILTQAETAYASGIDFDAIIILAGVNDFLNNIQLGDWYTISTENVVIGGGSTVQRQKRTLTSTNFQGSINTAMAYIKEHFPYAQIILMTPLHFNAVGYKNGSGSGSEMFANSNGDYIDAFVKAIREASDIWCCPLIDLFKESGISATVSAQVSQYFGFNPNENPLQNSDGLHPNKLGHFRISGIIRNKLLALGFGKYNNADIDIELS